MVCSKGNLAVHIYMYMPGIYMYMYYSILMVECRDVMHVWACVIVLMATLQ